MYKHAKSKTYQYNRGSSKEEDLKMSKSVPKIVSLLFALAISSPIRSAIALRKIPDPNYSGDSSAACWNAINAVGGCQDEIELAMKRNEIEVSYGCCRVMMYGLPEKCAAVVFSFDGEFLPEIGGAVKEYCDGLGVTPPVLETDDKVRVEEN